MKKRIQVKKKLALLLSSALLVTSMNVIPVKAAENNQATGSEVENAEASTKLSLEIASAPTPHDGHEGWIDLLTVSEGGGYEHEIKSSSNYYLSNNVVVGEKPFLHISGDIDVTICLNGQDISTNYYDVIKIDGNARVTITNCSGEESKISAGTAIGSLINQNGGKLTLEKVTLAEQQGSNYDYPLIHVNDGGNLTLNNVKFDSQGFCIRLMETGDINIANSTFTVDCSSLDGGGKIIYTDMDKPIGNITVTDSIFIWDKNDGIGINTPDHGSVNISGSTFNCSDGIRVKGGEVNVSDCIFEGTDEYSLGYAVYMTSVADKENKLTVSGGTCNTRQGGIGVNSVAAKVDLTLKGDIAFNHTSEYGDLVFFGRYDNSSKAQVNLNLGELKTQNLTMALPSIAYEDVIICEYEGAITCDADYSAILKARDTKYAVRCEEADGKYVVKFNERKITTQPTVESPKVEVSDNTDVSFQWYKAGKKEYELKNTASEGVIVPDTGEENYGTYENGVWKPAEFTEFDDSAYIVLWNLKEIKGNCTVVIENSNGSLEDYEESFDVMPYESYESFDSNVKEGKLYFSGKADGLTISGFEIPQNAELIVKLIVPNDTEALSGQNTATLSSAQPGDYRCHIIWDERTDYSYEILSDTLTINQAITPGEPGEEPEEPTPTPDTDKILAKAQEIVTSKIDGKEFTVSNLTTDKDIKNAIKTALLSDDKTKTVASEITVTKEDASTVVAGQIAINVKLSLNDKNITFDLKKVIDKLEGKNITVTVKDGNDNTVSGATVKVMLGKTQKAESTSVAGGSCTFSNLPAGLYNIVITKEGVTKTAIANITTNNATVSVVLDTSSVGSSHLDVKGTTVPETAAKVEETVVSNLDTLAEALKETDAAVDSYKVEMTVEAKADTYVLKSTKSEMVKEANKGETGAENKATNIDFLDIVIQKTITKNSVEQKPELIKDTGTTVMEIIIPFNFTGKTKVKVLREHDGVVEKFDETNPGTDGTCKIDRENERIILYATKFSTYAVSYVAEGESAIEPAMPPAYTGGGNSTPSTPSGGDSKPSTPTEEYTIPVESENAVEVKAEIKEGTADVSEITEETLSKVTDAKGESNVNTIKIDLSGAKQEVTGVTISKKSVETLAKATNDTTNGIDTVTIELSKATVVLDTKTLETLVEDAKGTNIRLVVDDKEHKELNTSQQTAVKDYHVATSFEAYFESDGVRIHDFKGGKATVSIEFTPETGKSIEHYHMVYLPDAGGMTRFKTKYENGQLIFTTTHFSDYAVIYDENEKNETGNEEEKPVEQKPAETQVEANTIAINKGLKVSQTGSKINVSWGEVADADGYLVYAAYCGADFGKAVKTIKDPSSVSTTITKINGKKLDLKKNFKVYVKAYKLADGKKVAFGTSITAHITGTKNAKNTNVKELKLTSKSKLTLAVGKTSKIKAKAVLVDSAKKQLSDSHTKEFRYASSNKKVAAVDKNGKITAKAKGTCYIYVYAKNGYAKKITVTVK